MNLFWQILLNGLIVGSFYALIALSFNLVFSTVRFLDLSVGVLAVVGGYLALWLTGTLGLPFALAFILAALATAGLSWFLNHRIYQSLRRQHATRMVQMTASLGVFIALQALIALLFTSQFQTLGSTAATVYQIGGATITTVQLVAFSLALLTMLLLALFMRYSLTGKAIRAIGDDHEVAKMMGLPLEKMIGRAFLLSGACAAVAGMLVGLDTGLEPTMGLRLLLKGAIAAIVGGIGNVYGGVAGAFLLGLIENFGAWQLSGEWKDVIAFSVLILFLLFRPKGIFKWST